MNRNSLDFLIPMFPFAHFSGFNILVINQTTPNAILESSYPSVRVVNSFERGLSRSRNLALSNAGTALCIVTDDDVVFASGFEEIILKAFNDNQNAALISFRVKTPQGNLIKKYPAKRKCVLTTGDKMNIMSVEMVLNTQFTGAVRFNEKFGLGSMFPMGEEALFIKELHERDLVIVMEPEVIAIHPEITTNNKLSIAEKYYIQGAFLTACFGNKYFKWLLIKLLFDLKQKKITLTQLAYALSSAAKGRKDFIATNENNSR